MAPTSSKSDRQCTAVGVNNPSRLNLRELSVPALRLALSSLQFTPDGALQMIAAYTLELFSAAGVAIALQRGQDVICLASAGNAPAVGAILTTDSGVSGECFRTGDIVRCRDSHSDPRIDASIRSSLGFRSVIVLPIRKEGRLVGILEVLGSDPDQFPDSQLPALKEVSDLSLDVSERTTRRTDPINTARPFLAEDLSRKIDICERSSISDLSSDLNAIYTKLDPDFQSLFDTLTGDRDGVALQAASVPNNLKQGSKMYSELDQLSNKASSPLEGSVIRSKAPATIPKKIRDEKASGMGRRRVLTIAAAFILLALLVVTCVRWGMIR